MTGIISGDASLMRRAFEGAMPGCRVTDCTLLHVRYKPGKSCLVSYRLSVVQAGKLGHQVVYARVYPSGLSESRFAKAQTAPQCEPAFGPPVYHLSDLNAVVWAFPNDRKLRGLAALVTTDASRILPLRHPSREVVQYVPEHGCTVRVNAQTGSEEVSLYGKTYPDDTGEATYRNMQALWNGDARLRGLLRMAQPLAYDPENRILWQSGVEGPTLAALESPEPAFLSSLTAAVRTIAVLHASRVPGLRPVTPDDYGTKLYEAEQRLSSAMPHYARRVSSLTAEVMDRLLHLGSRPDATLHADLHWKNIILDSHSAALIDLDNLRVGDPLHDLGSFLASTCTRGIVHGASAKRIADMAAAVIDSYEKTAACDVPRSVLYLHTAAALVAEQAHRTVIRMKPDRLACIDGMLGLAERALEARDFVEAIAA